MTNVFDSAKWHMKIHAKGTNADDRKKFEHFDKQMQETLSIGIGYGIDDDITSSTGAEIGVYLKELGFGSNSCNMVTKFIQEVDTGDKIIMGRGAQEVMYVVEIISNSYFTRDPRFETGGSKQRIRRNIKILEKLPPDSNIDCAFRGTLRRVSNPTLC